MIESNNEDAFSIWISVYQAEKFLSEWKDCYRTKDDDSNPSVSLFNDKIYLFYQSTDLHLDVIDLRTGSTLTSKTYSGTTSAIDIVVNHLGVFMLANIDDGFNDVDSPDSYSTQNGNNNFAIIFTDHDGNIIEIESYDTTDPSNDLGAEYPKKLVVGIQNKHQPLFGFISTRNNDENQRGGIYITQPTDQNALFTTGNTLASCGSVTPNCELCPSRGWFKWEDGYKIQNGECKLTCDDYHYHKHDDTDDTLDIDICDPCHQTCKTCSGPSEYECLSWDIDKEFDSVKGTWTWDPLSSDKYLGLNGEWKPSCGDELTGIYKNRWVRGCPEDSDDYSQKSNLIEALHKSSPINWESLTKHLIIIENTSAPLPFYVDHNMGISYTATFWIRVNSTSYSNFTILSLGKSMRITI